MNACQHDDESLRDAIPQDVRKSLQESTARATVPIRVRTWIGSNACNDSVHEFAPEPRTLFVIPIFSYFQVELGSTTDEDGQVNDGAAEAGL